MLSVFTFLEPALASLWTAGFPAITYRSQAKPAAR